jgi:hypothetical protein
MNDYREAVRLLEWAAHMEALTGTALQDEIREFLASCKHPDAIEHRN